MVWNGIISGVADKIPVVKTGFIFRQSQRNLAVFALCLIMVYVLAASMKFKYCDADEDQFYKLVAPDLETIYAFQVFLTIGGASKVYSCLPSDTSACGKHGWFPVKFYDHFCSDFQDCIHLRRQDEGEINASKSRKNRQNRKKTTGSGKRRAIEKS